MALYTFGQVIGVPDERLGEQVCAWVKLKEGEAATENEIKDFCKGQVTKQNNPLPPQKTTFLWLLAINLLLLLWLEMCVFIRGVAKAEM